jgi:pantetheine-phosphate adenylyltransferase
MNKHLSGVETLFIASAPDLQHVSSSLIKEVVRYGGDVSGLVPDHVVAALEERFRGS